MSSVRFRLTSSWITYKKEMENEAIDHCIPIRKGDWSEYSETVYAFCYDSENNKVLVIVWAFVILRYVAPIRERHLKFDVERLWSAVSLHRF